MSFYGNITNVTKTGFSFDRTYSNRLEMEQNMETDGVYIGRFVLVDYDQDSEKVRRAYYPIKTIDGKKDYYIENSDHITLYKDADLVNKIRFNSTGMIIDENNLVSGVNKNDICFLTKGDGSKDFFICIGEEIINNKETGFALFQRFTQGPSSEGIYRWNYAINYNTDQTYFGDPQNTSIGRGWDSTVWQKVYENEHEKYVMIAELNAVVPTLAISADAPTMNPITPHFDEVSNNTYYEIHWQPQWGARVKHVRGILSADSNHLVDSKNNLLSDETTTWISSIYNKDLDLHQYYYFGTDSEWHLAKVKTNTNEPIRFDDVLKFVQTQKDSQIPAAIYYNKAGFNPKVHFRSSASDNLQMTPTGFSQKPAFYQTEVEKDKDGKIIDSQLVAKTWETTKYNDHKRGTTAEKVDTQEWQMILPSLGNAISSMWDIVYGTGVDENQNPVYTYDKDGAILKDEADRPTGILDEEKTRLTYMDWEDGDFPNDAKRLRLVQQAENGFTYNVTDVETLAGCINTVHDLMGMIIVDKSDLNPKSEEFTKFVDQTDEDKIYFLSDNGYYRRGLGYNYDNLVDYIYEKVEVTKDDYQKNLYYYINAGEENLVENYKQDLDGVYDSTKTYFYKKIKSEGLEYSPVTLNTYEPGIYYYGSGDNYLLENNQTVRNVTYYNIDKEKIILEDKIKYNFFKESYYEKRSDGAYQLASTDIPEKDVYYSAPSIITPPAIHPLSIAEEYNFETQTFKDRVLTYFWVPGAFAVKSDDEVGYRLTDLNATFDPNEEYFLIDWKRKVEMNPDTGETYYTPLILETMDGKKKVYKVNLLPIEENRYYKLVASGEGETTEYVYLPATQELINEEYKDLGRYRLENIDEYADDYSPNFKRDIYYELSPVEEFLKEEFYVSNKFYYIDENNYIKDKSPLLTEGREYWTILDGAFTKLEHDFYQPNTYYYKDDVYYILDKSFLKQDVQYYIRNYFYVASDLEGLYSIGSQWNRGVDIIPCTIELANRTEFYEMKVLPGFARTFNTIHGLIINMNKILASGDYDTRDRNTVQGCINLINDIINKFEEFTPRQFLISDNYGRVSSTPVKTNEWIDININGTPDSPQISVVHTYPFEEEHTFTSIDLNQNKEDTIEVETITLDSMGHVSTVNTETVTLPYGYKILTDGENNAVASNTQDTFTFNGDNWIAADVSAENKTLTITHKTANKSVETAGEETSVNLDFGDSFESLFIGVDNLGHVKNLQNTTITLPKGSIEDISDEQNRASVMTNLTFNATTGALKYKKQRTTNLLLTDFTYDASLYGNIQSADTIGEAFSRVQTRLNTLNTQFENLDDKVDTVNSNLSSQISELNSNLSSQISGLNSNLSSVNTTLNNKINSVETSLTTKINNVETSLSTSITNTSNVLHERINGTESSILQLEALIGVAEGSASLSVQQQIAQAFEDFKNNELKNYALIAYVDEEIQKAIQVDTNTEI